MMALSIKDLVSGLERFGDKYAALDVYVADVKELRDAGSSVPSGWVPSHDNAYLIHVNSRAYQAEVVPQHGVLRLRRAPEPNLEPLVGALSGLAVGALVSKKPEAVLAGAIVGMLVAKALGTDDRVREVFTMRFNPTAREWQAYSGPLIPTMKKSLGLTPA